MPDTIPFAEWTPDQSDRRNAALEAKGVLSIAGNYAPLKDLEDYNGSDAATATTCIGIKGVYDSSNNGQVFFGDTTKLYTLTARAADDISQVGDYAIGADDWWMFEQFGDYVVAVADGATPQVFQMGVSTEFADLGGSPPDDATCVARVNDFLFMGKGNTVHWSAFNDITDWTPSATTQAGNQEMNQEHGRIQTIVGGQYAAIFQERAIRRATYAGPPVLWDFGQDAIETKRGAIGPLATVKVGANIFFVSDDGFYVFDGQSSTGIGSGKVDNYFQRRVNYGYRQKICAAADTINKLVFFGFPNGASTTISEVLIYSLTDGRWTRAEFDLDILTDMPVEALTVDTFHTYETSDDLDTTNLDPFNIDSNVFDEKRRLIAGVRLSNHRIATLTGSNLTGVIETGEFEAMPGKRAMVTELWPMGDFEQANVSCSVGYRRALPGAAVAYTSATSMNRVGYCPQRIDARFLRARMQVAAGSAWTRAEGVHHTTVATGGR